MTILAALLALTSCSSSDNPVGEPVVPPTETEVGEWFGQVMSGGIINGKLYDTCAILITFQADGYGLIQQYFLNGSQLVYNTGNAMQYSVDDDGHIKIFVKGTNIQMGIDARITDGHVFVSMPDYLIYDLKFDHPTAAQQQLISEWGILIDESSQSDAEDKGENKTKVVTDGADEPARSRSTS